MADGVQISDEDPAVDIGLAGCEGIDASTHVEVAGPATAVLPIGRELGYKEVELLAGHFVPELDPNHIAIGISGVGVAGGGIRITIIT